VGWKNLWVVTNVNGAEPAGRIDEEGENKSGRLKWDHSNIVGKDTKGDKGKKTVLVGHKNFGAQ